jgi:hypothetical protein
MTLLDRLCLVPDHAFYARECYEALKEIKRLRTALEGISSCATHCSGCQSLASIARTTLKETDNAR